MTNTLDDQVSQSSLKQGCMHLLNSYLFPFLFNGYLFKSIKALSALKAHQYVSLVYSKRWSNREADQCAHSFSLLIELLIYLKMGSQ